jgi:hypothetical protein
MSSPTSLLTKAGSASPGITLLAIVVGFGLMLTGQTILLAVGAVVLGTGILFPLVRALAAPPRQSDRTSTSSQYTRNLLALNDALRMVDRSMSQIPRPSESDIEEVIRSSHEQTSFRDDPTPIVAWEIGHHLTVAAREAWNNAAHEAWANAAREAWEKEISSQDMPAVRQAPERDRPRARRSMPIASAESGRKSKWSSGSEKPDEASRPHDTSPE